jgi:hypothetical protein
MFRLIKLAFYGFVGYMLYELYQGMTSGGGRFSGPVNTSRDLNRAANQNTGRMQTLTGEGQGQNVSTLDDSGASARHTVGRGVTST